MSKLIFNVGVNLWAVFAAAVTSVVIGSIWYGPLFGKKYRSLAGMDKLEPAQNPAMKRKVIWGYLGQVALSLIMFYVLAGVILWTVPQLTAVMGMAIAFWIWLGFILPIKLADVLWGGKITLFWLSAGNMLLTMLAAGAIIGAWK